jgi:hypothetical protein
VKCLTLHESITFGEVFGVLGICVSFCFVCFVVKEICRSGMRARGDDSVVNGVLACYNGMKFRLNDLADVIVWTVPGVRATKCEPFTGRFKGVVETERGVEFLVRPIVGSEKGRCMQLPQHSVLK